MGCYISTQLLKEYLTGQIVIFLKVVCVQMWCMCMLYVHMYAHMGDPLYHSLPYSFETAPL